jgi:hypothetical protein
MAHTLPTESVVASVVEQQRAHASALDTKGLDPMSRPAWDDQFAENDDEVAERWRVTKARRKAEGKCWQCAKLIALCTCPNVKHDRKE